MAIFCSITKETEKKYPQELRDVKHIHITLQNRKIIMAFVINNNQKSVSKWNKRMNRVLCVYFLIYSSKIFK